MSMRKALFIEKSRDIVNLIISWRRHRDDDDGRALGARYRENQMASGQSSKLLARRYRPINCRTTFSRRRDSAGSAPLARPATSHGSIALFFPATYKLGIKAAAHFVS